MATPKPAEFFNVFLDSDGPVADFDKDLVASGMHTDEFKHQPGIYLWLGVTDGAEASIAKLKEWDDSGYIRVFIATKTPSGSPYAYTEKVLWYRKTFPWLEDRVILAHDKSVLGGPEDFILDDRPHKGNVSMFKGTFVEFDVTNPVDSWIRFMHRVESRLIYSLNDKFGVEPRVEFPVPV